MVFQFNQNIQSMSLVKGISLKEVSMEIKTGFHCLILILCHIFVTYMAVQCFSQYFEHPQGVDLKVQDVMENISPQFTICDSEKYDISVLRECGLEL